MQGPSGFKEYSESFEVSGSKGEKSSAKQKSADTPAVKVFMQKKESFEGNGTTISENKSIGNKRASFQPPTLKGLWEGVTKAASNFLSILTPKSLKPEFQAELKEKLEKNKQLASEIQADVILNEMADHERIVKQLKAGPENNFKITKDFPTEPKFIVFLKTKHENVKKIYVKPAIGGRPSRAGFNVFMDQKESFYPAEDKDQLFARLGLDESKKTSDESLIEDAMDTLGESEIQEEEKPAEAPLLSKFGVEDTRKKSLNGHKEAILKDLNDANVETIDAGGVTKKDINMMIAKKDSFTIFKLKEENETFHIFVKKEDEVGYQKYKIEPGQKNGQNGFFVENDGKQRFVLGDNLKDLYEHLSISSNYYRR